MYAACCALLVAPVLTSLAGGGVPIEFSAPASDVVISNIFEKGRPTSSVLEQVEDDLLSPLFKPDSSGSLGPVLSVPNRRVAVPSQRARELQEQNRNWLFMEPDEYLRRSSGAESFDYSEEDAFEVDEAGLSIYERYYLKSRERQSKAAIQAVQPEFSPVISIGAESGASGDFETILNSVGQSGNPFSGLLPPDEVRTTRNQFGNARLDDSARLGGAFGANLLRDPLQQSRLDSFQQLLRPEQALTSARDAFEDILKPGANLNPLAGQTSIPGGTLPGAGLNNPVQASTVGTFQQPDPFNSAFETPDPFEVQTLQDPNVSAFGQFQRETDQAVGSRQRNSFVPLVLPRPTRDF